MKRNTQIGLAILIIALIGTGVGIGVYFVFNQPGTTEVDLLSINDGILEFNFTMSELKSDKYEQVENQFYQFVNSKGTPSNGTYSGVSLRSILEEEKILYSGALNFSFAASDYNPGLKKGWLNISMVMDAPYELCILAYGGEDFETTGEEPDGPILSVINHSIVPSGIPSSSFKVRNCIEVIFAGYEEGNYEPLVKTDVALTIHSRNLQYQLTMSELQSDKYVQITDQTIFFDTFGGLQNGTFSGVSLRSILEEEELLGENALNYSFVGGDGFNPAIMGPKGGYLNVSKIMQADYGLCILSYGGPDFEEGDGPLMPVINQTLVPSGARAKGYQVTNCTDVLFV